MPITKPVVPGNPGVQGNYVVVVDVGGQPGLPALNGANLTDLPSSLLTLQEVYDASEPATITTDATGALTVTGTQRIVLTSSEANAASIDINSTNAAGGIDIDAVGAIGINTSGANDDITISADGVGTSQLILQSGGTGTNAIRVLVTGTSGGGIDVDGGAGTGAGAGGLIAINSGAGGPTGIGGGFTATSGAGGGTSGASGPVTIQSGTTTDGSPGAVTIQTPNAAGAGANNGGDIILRTGALSGTGTNNGGLRLRGMAAINTSAGASATIHAPAGRFRKAAGGGASFALTNNFITANSIVIASFANAAVDGTATTLTVQPGASPINITFNAAPTSNCDVNFWVITND